MTCSEIGTVHRACALSRVVAAPDTRGRSFELRGLRDGMNVEVYYAGVQTPTTRKQTHVATP